MIFLDGVGLGRADDPANPLATTFYPGVRRLAGGQSWTQDAATISNTDHVFRGIDATLGIEGLPQSGTGQASLLTGVNCARIAGRHFGPYPHSRTRPIIKERNVFRQVMAREGNMTRTAAFANAYPRRFFTYARERERWTVTTRCCLDAGVEIRTTDRLVKGEAVSADITGADWPEGASGYSPITEGEAALRLLRLARSHDFTLFEYYLTDKAGHSQDAVMARHVLESVDRLLQGILGEMDPSYELLLVTSDHGNLEDLSTRVHTRNAVPLVAFGSGAEEFADVNDLTGVVPAIISALS